MCGRRKSRTGARPGNDKAESGGKRTEAGEWPRAGQELPPPHNARPRPSPSFGPVVWARRLGPPAPPATLGPGSRNRTETPEPYRHRP